jgi:hypothetical protein
MFNFKTNLEKNVVKMDKDSDSRIAMFNFKTKTLGYSDRLGEMLHLEKMDKPL